MSAARARNAGFERPSCRCAGRGVRPVRGRRLRARSGMAGRRGSRRSTRNRSSARSGACSASGGRRHPSTTASATWSGAAAAGRGRALRRHRAHPRRGLPRRRRVRPGRRRVGRSGTQRRASAPRAGASAALAHRWSRTTRGSPVSASGGGGACGGASGTAQIWSRHRRRGARRPASPRHRSGPAWCRSAAVACAPLTGGWSLRALALYPLRVGKIARGVCRDAADRSATGCCGARTALPRRSLRLRPHRARRCDAGRGPRQSRRSSTEHRRIVTPRSADAANDAARRRRDTILERPHARASRRRGGRRRDGVALRPLVPRRHGRIGHVARACGERLPVAQQAGEFAPAISSSMSGAHGWPLGSGLRGTPRTRASHPGETRRPERQAVRSANFGQSAMQRSTSCGVGLPIAGRPSR